MIVIIIIIIMFKLIVMRTTMMAIMMGNSNILVGAVLSLCVEVLNSADLDQLLVC